MSDIETIRAAFKTTIAALGLNAYDTVGM